MNTKFLIRTLIICGVLLVNIGCDQVSKNIVRQNIEYHERIELIDDYLTLTKVENSGAFLSLGNSLAGPLRFILLLLLPALALIYGTVFLLTKTQASKPMIFGLACIIGGGVGNLYDRFLYGSVTDFLHIDFVIFQTGIFNMADVSIMLGFFVLIVDSFSSRTSLS